MPPSRDDVKCLRRHLTRALEIRRDHNLRDRTRGREAHLIQQLEKIFRATRKLRLVAAALCCQLHRYRIETPLRMKLDDRPGLTHARQGAAAVDLSHSRQWSAAGRD